MMLNELSEVPEAALPLAAFRAHLHLGSGFAEDSLQDVVLVGFLRAALAAIEGRTGKVLLERDFAWAVTSWRDPSRQVLPLAPVTSVKSFVVETAQGDTLPVPDRSWRLLPDAQQPSIEALSGTLQSIPSGGIARFVLQAGYGPDWTGIPADLAQAVMMLATHYYEYRHETGLGSGCMPFGVTALTERYRTVRLTLGGRA